jgi:Mce-associated membrane protein
MAEHADTTNGQLNDMHPFGDNGQEPEHQLDDDAAGERETGDDDAEESGTDEELDGTAKIRAGRRVSDLKKAIAVGTLAVVALGSLAGWLAFQTYEARRAQQQRDLLVGIARQAAVNLTSIDFTRVDSDVQRILESSTGKFHDDFQTRSQPFVDVVKQAQSKSEGAVTAAGLESQIDGHGQVLIAVSVKTSIAGAPEQPSRSWRMRISVQNDSHCAKVSDVQFVP